NSRARFLSPSRWYCQVGKGGGKLNLYRHPTFPISWLPLPPEIISYAVWLYHRFCLTFWDVEEVLAERGVNVSSEAVRQWCLKLGSSFTKKLRHRQGRLGEFAKLFGALLE